MNTPPPPASPPVPRWLVETLRIGLWPVWLRKPLVLALIARKKLHSLPFEARLHGLRYHGDAANLIDYHILSRGGFEPGLTRLLWHWGEHQAGGLLLDVGANLGVHSLGAARAFAQVIAVEPFAPLVARLRRTLEDNHIGNVSVVATALGASVGEAIFQPPTAGNLGTGRLRQAESEAAVGPDGLTRVPVQTGDALLATQPLPLAAVKIDVEGAEGAVLAGLQQALQRQRPLVVCEVLSAQASQSGRFRAAFPADYRFYALRDIRSRCCRLTPWQGEAADVAAVPAEHIAWLDGWLA